MKKTMQTGVCYYPEHWPESRWAMDAAHMRRLGLAVVRIGEFAWSRLEPAPGDYRFDWLERAIDTLQDAGLSIVLGTPTATPPRWLVQRDPSMLACDEQGRPRGFGSRRHYCFSSRSYRDECARIVTELARRFGEHPGIFAWQTDNEYGCHDTTLSYSPAALEAFRGWCRTRYGSIGQLNDAWGNVFWSMEYSSFDQIEFPVAAVTETSPSHRLAFWRFSSAQIASFNALQVEILRELSPGRDITHNFMGYFPDFDHRLIAQDLDVAAWDNYPLGQLVRHGTAADRATFMRTGHPDSSAFHHDLYRTAGRGRMWLMEQQPGPVNWAIHNPAPLAGMVRLWGWEAFAHGAEVVSYFRWRQAPFAQEQMHTGLLLPDGTEDIGAHEVRQLGAELAHLEHFDTATRQAQVALVYDYTGDCLQRIQQPGGLTFDPLHFTMRVYTACRQLGVDVDVVGPDDELAGYSLLLLPTATESNEKLAEKLGHTDAEIVLFARTGSKTVDNTIPEGLPPGAFRSLIDMRVTRVESLPPDARLGASPGAVPNTGRNATPADDADRRDADELPGLTVIDWREWVDSSVEASHRFDDGSGIHFTAGRVHYLNGCPDQHSLTAFMEGLFDGCAIPHRHLDEGMRVRRCGEVCFAFNYGPATRSLDGAGWERFGLAPDAALLIGTRSLMPGELAAWAAPTIRKEELRAR